jgi:hypothetical protein
MLYEARKVRNDTTRFYSLAIEAKTEGEAIRLAGLTPTSKWVKHDDFGRSVTVHEIIEKITISPVTLD